MRGGAIPFIAWGILLALLTGTIWVWSGDMIDVAMFGFAVLMIWAWAAVLAIRRPRALRRGEPEAMPEPEALPSASYGAVLLACGVAALLYGFAFGRALVYLGAGLTVAALGVLARELYDQRRLLRQWRRGTEG